MQNKWITRKKIVRLVLVCVFLELFVFNFKHWESYFFPKTAVYQTVLGPGLDKISDTKYQVTNRDQVYIELTDISEHVDNLYLDISSQDKRVIPIQISMTDAANTLYRTLAETEVVRGIPASQYIRMHLSGESETLKVALRLDEGMELAIQNVALNAVRPLMIEPVRIFVLLLAGFLFCLFRPSSELYKEAMNLKDARQRRFLGFIVGLQLVILAGIGVSAQPYRSYENDTWEAHAQYEDLADALIDGHVYLNMEPPEFLKKMDNPYDTELRFKLAAEAGESCLFDFAYFNGKYYCYFGIVPALLFFVPFKLITGTGLPTWVPVLFCGLAYCILAYVFLYQLITKMKLRVSYGLYILLTSVFICGSAILYLIHFGNVYSMPIILGLCFGIAGLSAWLGAKNSEGGSPKKGLLVLGSVCMALVIGCRLQLAVAMFFAFPIFWEEIRKRYFFSKEGALNTCCVIVPFIIIGCALGYYNYIRFGSFFDFGAAYNLTSNDMTHKGFMFSRNFLGVFEYLLQPLNIKSSYPFMENINVRTEWQGYWSMEPLLGGWLWYNLIGVFALLSFKYRKLLREKKLFDFSILALAGALLIIEADIQMSGLTQRYMSDFGWLFILSAIIVILVLYNHVQEGPLKSLFLKMVIALSALCIFTNCFSILMDGRYASLRDTSSLLFYGVKYMFFKC